MIFLPGLSNHHRTPEGVDRWFQVSQVREFARHRDVWWVQRRQGLTRGTSMADICRDYAIALADRFGGPVDVIGSSTGGSVGLQLAADHPEAVRRLVLLSSACRLGAGGRDVQRRLAEALRRERPRKAGALMLSMLAPGAGGQWALSVVGWLLGPAVLRGASSDLLRTIEAEDSFDLTPRLAFIETPTLVVGGGRDGFYGADVYQETAAGLPNGHLLFHPGKGHVGAQMSRRSMREAIRFLDRQ